MNWFFLPITGSTWMKDNHISFCFISKLLCWNIPLRSFDTWLNGIVWNIMKVHRWWNSFLTCQYPNVKFAKCVSRINGQRAKLFSDNTHLANTVVYAFTVWIVAILRKLFFLNDHTFELTENLCKNKKSFLMSTSSFSPKGSAIFYILFFHHKIRLEMVLPEILDQIIP